MSSFGCRIREIVILHPYFLKSPGVEWYKIHCYAQMSIKSNDSIIDFGCESTGTVCLHP